MQFNNIVLLLAAAFTVSAAPGPNTLSKRSCGTLTGTALKVCQDACKATCDVATGGLARELCKEACDLGPLKTRDAEAAPAPAPNTLSKRSCGTLTGTALKVCQDACKATCDVATGGLARKLCKEACDLGPLKARDAETVTIEVDANEVDADEVAKRGVEKKICDATCDVTCNSTFLALDQLECLKLCKEKC